MGRTLTGVGRLLFSRRLAVAGIDLMLVAAAYYLAFMLHADFHFTPVPWGLLFSTLPVVLTIRGVIFAWFHLDERLWRYVSMGDIVSILKAVTLSSVLFSTLFLLILGKAFPRRVLLLDWILCLALVGGVRLAFRAVREANRNDHGHGRRTIVVGAGDAGEMLVREIERNPGLNYQVVGFVDDDSMKLGKRIHGKEVLGRVDQLVNLSKAHGIEELLIAIPSATGPQIRRIIGTCRAAEIQFKTVPNVAELMDAPHSLAKVRRVNIDDLLRREPVRIDSAELQRFLQGKRVLVTGAGGSIGSELCRQVARFGPEQLILLDRGENGVFFVEMELRERLPHLPVNSVIGDVTDENRIRSVFQEHRPQIVIHAAAHKHVPLMEVNKAEAIRNNVLGTMVVSNMAERYGVEDFVLISTDKAVRPSSVMGATKRLAEMYIQSLNHRARTRFMTVRFGNVLGSEGSVLQIFQRQIEAGGPVTVTHPEMKRYFMTIPEASQLVLQAATQGKGGEVFVLDMGEPVSIVDLAKDLIALSGLDPEKDIEIRFTSPRPGEKLFEELLNRETRISPTRHEKVMVVQTDPVDCAQLKAGIHELMKAAEAGEEELLLTRLKRLVPDYSVERIEPAVIPPEKQRRILLAVDDLYTRTTLKRILENSYQVFEAEDRRQALKQIKECNPHLVILDSNLRGANIRRLCRRLRRENGHPPIIVVMESAESASLEQVLDLGADDRLYKPIPVNILEGRVKRLIERGESGMANAANAKPINS